MFHAQTWTIGIAVVVLALTVSAGCFPDFERFKDVTFEEEADAAQSADSDNADTSQQDTATTADSNAGEDVAVDAPLDTNAPDTAIADTETADTDAPDVEGDTSEVADTAVDADVMEVEDTAVEDVGEDMVVNPTGPVGQACALDAECPAGQVCRGEFDGGLCTVGCGDGDDACPEGSVCASAVGVPWCVPTCVGEGCDRDGYDCLPWLDAAEPSLCVSDGDGDRALNSLDNCLEVANPDQADQDRDGEGDRCDSEPRCPGEVTVTLPTPPSPLRGGAVVPVAPLDAMFVLGGVDGIGAPIDQVVWYDFEDEVWATDSPLPYAAAKVDGVFDRRRGQLVLTPGDGRGRLLLRTVTSPGGVEPVQGGEWRQGPLLPMPLWSAKVALMGLDTLLVTGFSAALAEDPEFAWVAYVVDLGTGRVEVMDGSFALNPESVGDVQAIAGSDGAFYLLNSGQRSRYYRVDPVAQTFEGPELLLFELFFEPVPLRDRYPIIGWGAQAPFVYFARLDQGIIQKIDLDVSSAQSSPYQLLLPDMLTVETTAYGAAYRPSARSLVTLITPEGAEAVTVAQEHFLLCTRGDEFDKDNDAATNLLDNCPSVRNVNQVDLDGDGAGDACDPDLDGDGRLNADDLEMGEDGQVIDLQFDTDNDGIDNIDDPDDDNDRITDDRDPLPLDTDNDALPNALDADDDGDGVSDTAEREAGSDPTDYLSVPGGERVTYVRMEAGVRALVVTTLGELGDGVDPAAVDVGGASPTWPRLESGGDGLVYVDIAAEPVAVVMGIGEPIRVALGGVVAGGVDFAPDARRLALLRQEEAAWHIDVVAQEQWLVAEPEMMRVATRVDVGTGLDVADEAMLLAFTEQAVGCAICADAYIQAWEEAGTGTLAADMGLAERFARLSDDGQWLLVVVERDGGGQAYRWRVGSEEAAEPITDPRWDVQSAEFAPSAERLLISASENGEAHRLYLVEPGLGRVTPLTNGAAPAVEVSVSR